jgi:hypothetical protein
MEFNTRLLYEISLFEDLGLVAYINNLFDRRWTDFSLRGFIFAVAKLPLIPDPPIFLESKVNTIGNNAFLCTIIIIDLGVPMVLVIMNQAYVFTHHCLDEVPYDASHIPISVICKTGPITIISLDHKQLMHDGIMSCVLNIPRRVKPVIEEIIRLNAARILNCIYESDKCGYLITSSSKRFETFLVNALEY